MATTQADGVEPRSRYSLRRDDFKTWRSYVYFNVWNRFIIRESQATGFVVPEDASEDEIKQLRIAAGLCIMDVELKPESRCAVFPSKARCAFRPKNTLWLSRVDPAQDCFNHPLEIIQVTNTSTVIFKDGTIFPDDATEGRWRLDAAHEQSQAPQQLDHVKTFAKKSDDPLQNLVVEDLLFDPGALSQAQTYPGPTACRRDLHQAAASHKLNERQTQAFLQVFDNRCSLIQGPPGTGKTLTARAITCESEKGNGITLLSAVTNSAVDHLAMTAKGRLSMGMARVVSQRYEEELLANKDTPQEMRDIVFPEIVRLYLDSFDYDRNANKYKEHVKKYTEDVLKMNNVKTFAATCSMVGTKPASLKHPFSLILIDEAAQATEPEVVQVFNVALCSTSVHQIGDHKQLPATVSHPENKSDNNDISMFQRLLTSGLFPIVVLQVQHRMQEAIAAYPSQQFYADGWITATAPKGRTPHGFWWPSQDPVAFVNVRSSIGEQRGNNSTNSFYNSAEAKKVAQIVDEFQKYGGWLPSDIGVITAYASQVAEIQKELRLKKSKSPGCSLSTKRRAENVVLSLFLVCAVMIKANWALLMIVADSTWL